MLNQACTELVECIQHDEKNNCYLHSIFIPMLISGIQTFSLIDFPQKKSCIIFTAGCNFRCGFCHNPEFVLPEHLTKMKKDFITEQALFNFLDQRKGLLDGVVISGGEPTIMPDLPDIFSRIRALGFATKLDTNGSNPDMLKKLLEQNLVDYVAMDLKTTPDQYPEKVGMCLQPERIIESMEIIKTHAPEYEFRTTLIQELHPPETLTAMAQLIGNAQKWYLQEYRPQHTLDPSYANSRPFSEEEMLALAKKVRPIVPNVKVRISTPSKA